MLQSVGKQPAGRKDFNNNIYEMKSGQPMGSVKSLLSTNIFMDFIEEQIFKTKHNIIKNVFWCSYIDGIFCIWNNNLNILNIFLNFINNIHPNIQFTIKIENDNKINFLDFTTYKDLNTEEYSIYRKPTHTDIVMPQ